MEAPFGLAPNIARRPTLSGDIPGLVEDRGTCDFRRQMPNRKRGEAPYLGGRLGVVEAIASAVHVREVVPKSKRRCSNVPRQSLREGCETFSSSGVQFRLSPQVDVLYA